MTKEPGMYYTPKEILEPACGTGGFVGKIATDSLAARIRAARARLGLTQPEFAARLGVSFRTLCGWEAGEHVPQGLQLKAVMKAVNSERNRT